MPYLLTVRTSIPLGIDRVFAFFSDVAHLDRLTPPWLRVRVETPLPIAMAPGRLLDYRLRLHRIPIRWRTEITELKPVGYTCQPGRSRRVNWVVRAAAGSRGTRR